MINASKLHASSDDTDSLIPLAHVTPFHAAIADALLIATGLGGIALVVARYLSWEYVMDSWTGFTPLVILSMAGIWSCFFLLASAKLFVRTYSAAPKPRTVYVSSARIVLGGICYSGCWVGLSAGLKFFPENQLPFLIGASGAALIHLIGGAMFYSDLLVVGLNLVAASAMGSLGVVVYLLPKGDWFFWADLIGAISATSLMILSGLSRRWFIAVGLFFISVSYWLATFLDWQIVTTVVFTLGMGLNLYGCYRLLENDVAKLVGLLFGSWSRLKPLDSGNADVEDPLLSSSKTS